MIGLLGLGLVAAQQAGVSRSLPVAPVAPDGGFPVTINNVGLADGFGSVVETLPAGFSYVEDSAASTGANAVIDAVVDGQTVTFTVVGVDSFTYRVRVGSDVADGEHTFIEGVLKKLSGDETIAESTVTVEAGTTTTPPTGTPRPDDTTTPGDLSRSLPGVPVAPDDEFTVTISNVGLADGFGTVVETLPAGFSYVDNSAASPTPRAVIDVEVSDDGRTVTFTLVAVDSFTYGVRVGSDVADDEYTFKGVLEKLSGIDRIADSTVTVEAGTTTTPGDLSRSLPEVPVAPGGVFTVTISNVGLADGFGTVVETLPDGFSYVDNSATSPTPRAVIDVEVSDDGRTVTFTLVAVDSFTYRVRVGSDVEDDEYTFRGVLEKLSGEERIADSTITVGTSPAPAPAPAPSPAPTPRFSRANEAPEFLEGHKASRSVAEASASGTTVGERVAAEGPDRIAYTLIGADADSFAIDPNSGQITVGAATSLDYEVKDSYKIRVRAADRFGGRAFIEVTIAVINVDEAGTVSLSSMEPQVGTVLTATVTDPDGSVSDVTWSWAKSSDQSAWTDISGGTSATYTPVRDDGENYLRATATYIDGEGSGKTAVAVSANAVHVDRPTGVIEPPSVGDASVPSAAEIALILSLALLGAGSLLVLRGRRSRSRS